MKFLPPVANCFCLSFILAIAACKPPMTDEQIAMMTNDQLCTAVKSHPDDIRLVTFMGGRNLQCHPTQITCKKAGFQAGTKDFTNCVNTLIQSEALEEQEARANAQRLSQSFKDLGDSFKTYPIPMQQTHTTNCTNTQWGFNCTSY